MEGSRSRRIAPKALTPPPELSRPASGSGGTVSVDEVRFLVAHGILAPSGGNNQPWRFHFRGGRLLCCLRESQTQSFLDFQRGGALVGLGAAVENMALAASALNLAAHAQLSSDLARPNLVSTLTFERRADVELDPLFAHVSFRVTNRKPGTRTPLRPEDAGALIEAAGQYGARLLLLQGERVLGELGQILGEADRLAYLCEPLHRELMAELRWTPEQVLATRDGFDVATLELSASELAALKMCASWPAMAYLRQLGGGKAFEQRARAILAASSAAGLIVVLGVGHDSYFQAGRVLERVWLTATARCLALSPRALPYLFARLERGGGAGLSDAEQATLTALRTRYRTYFDVPPGHAEALLFRVAYADPPTARSIRHRLEDVLVIED